MINAVAICQLKETSPTTRGLAQARSVCKILLLRATATVRAETFASFRKQTSKSGLLVNLNELLVLWHVSSHRKSILNRRDGLSYFSSFVRTRRPWILRTSIGGRGMGLAAAGWENTH